MRTPLDSSRGRSLALAVATLRVLVGAVAMAAPDRALRPWVGDGGRGPARRVLARSLGVRDLALGLGALVAARRGAPLRGWVEAGALADTGDAIGTAMSFGSLPRFGRLLVLAASAGAAGAGAMAARSL